MKEDVKLESSGFVTFIITLMLYIRVRSHTHTHTGTHTHTHTYTYRHTLVVVEKVLVSAKGSFLTHFQTEAYFLPQIKWPVLHFKH